MLPVVVCLVLFSAAPENQWPAFLGGGRIEVSSPLPTDFAAERIAWERHLPGYGQSSPIIWNDQVFATSIEGPRKEKCHVAALALSDGSLRWKYTFDAAEQTENNNYTSKAAPTPTTDGEHLFAFFESGDVVALSLDGKERWKRSLTTDYGKLTTRHGLAASPLLVDDALVLLIDHDGPSYLVGLDRRTGKSLWKTERTSRTSWSSPALLTIGGKKVIVCSSSGSVDGYAPENGELLWTFDQVGGNTVNTPIAYADGRFLIGAGTGEKTNLALEVRLQEGKWTPSVHWSTTEASSSFGSPIVYAGHAYFVNKTGVLYCLDAETGELKYSERLKQTIWATPIASGDRIYLFGKGGKITIIATGPEFKVLREDDLWATTEMESTGREGHGPEGGARKASGLEGGRGAPGGSPTLYGVAVAGDRMLLRRGDRLYCVRSK